MAGAPIPNSECADGGCPELTTSIATTGLCLDDNTPIAIVVTRDCDGVVTEDGWLDLTTGTFTAGPPPPGTSACTTDNYDFALSGWLCDILPDGSVAGIALVQIERDGSGAVIGITLIGVDGLPYVPVGTMTRCPEDRLAAEVLCDAGAANTPFVRFYTYSPVGSIPARDTDLDGNPYVVVGPVVRCLTEIDDSTPVDVNVTNTPLPISDGGGSITVDGTVDVGNFPDDAEFLILCDFPPLFPNATVVPFLRRYDVDDAGVVTTTDTDLDGVTPYVPTVGGAVSICDVAYQDFEPEVLCDFGNANTQFLRRYRDTALGVLTTDTDLDGTTPYVVVGPVGTCADVTGTVDVGNWRDDAEYAVLCDLGAANTPFVRRYDVSDTGVVTTTDTALDGTTPYVVVGPAGICPVSGSVSVSSLPEPVSVDDNGGSLTVDTDGGPLDVAIDTAAGDTIRMGRVRLNGAGASWTFASTGGGRVKSVTVICLDDGVAGGPGAGSDVTVIDSFTNSFDMNTGQTFSWSTDAIDDELTDGAAFTVVLGPGGANAYVDVLWTEVL